MIEPTKTRPADDDAVVETFGLTKRFGKRVAVAGIDLRVPAACAFGFLGPNGAGKTTLIRMLLGLTGPSAGEMRLLGLQVPERRQEALRRVGAIVEEPRFHSHLTGRENLRAAAAVRGHECFARIEPCLDRVGLLDRADERVSGYSLGMRQRLGIARCLLTDPALLILDEPMNGLDPAGILEMRGLIRAFVDEGRTVFLSSHLLDEVERTCDQVAIIDRGHVVTQGATAEVAAGGESVVLIGCDDPDSATAVLARDPRVGSVSPGERGQIRVALAAGAPEDATAAAINRLLVESGLDVHQLERSRVSLEQRFLEITSRLGADD
jgi:ABC-2 type transport system ATP-binding protein